MYQYTRRQFEKILKQNKFYLDRCKGDHFIYVNEKGTHISVPFKLNACIALRLIKQNNLKIF